MRCLGRITPDTKQETRIYPLPHTYVIKDLVPDLTQFYRQHRTIKPYLQRTTPSPDVGAASPPGVQVANMTIRAKSTVKARRIERSWMDCMNAFCAPAARRRAHRIGGTRKNIWVQLFSCSPTAGWPIREMSAEKSEKLCSTTR